MVEDPPVGSGDHDDVGERPAGPLKSVRVRLALLIVAIAIVGAGLVWYFDHQNRGKFMQKTDNAYVAADSVVVAPKVAGYVERVFVSANQAVRKGQQLAELDPREYRAQSEQITSQIDTAKAAVETKIGRASCRERV